MSTTVRQPKGRWGQPEGASAPVHGYGVVGEPRVVEEPRELLDPVTQLALLASSDPNPGAELDGLRDMPGLAARLASMAEELRLITRSYPTWCLPEVGVGDAVGQAQRVRDLAHNLTAVLAGEV